MITDLTVEALQHFETEVASIFNKGTIRAPIHLEGGNEKQLIKIFEDIKSEDWICATWRSHYKCLLKGVPQDRLMKDICDGYSITLTYPDYRIITSAIVGGIIKMATGIAYGIKEQGGSEKVWCFVGDMTAMSGDMFECQQYAENFDLPINFVVEKNGKSVGTPTKEVWGKESWLWVKAIEYDYVLPWPHSGAGKWVEF